MKQVVVTVPEKQFKFFLELINSLGFSNASEKEIIVPESHKKIIRERISTAGTKSYSDWDKVKNKIKLG